MKTMLSASGVYTGETELQPLTGPTVPTVHVNLRRSVLERKAKPLPAKIRECARQSDLEEARELEADLAELEHRISLLQAIKTKNNVAEYNHYIKYVTENA